MKTSPLGEKVNFIYWSTAAQRPLRVIRIVIHHVLKTLMLERASSYPLLPKITFPQLYFNTFKKIVLCCRVIAQGDVRSSKAPGYYCHVSFILGLREPSQPNVVR